MSDKALTTFERRFEDWSATHPMGWVATTDRRVAARFISEQTEKIRKAQLQAADRIIVSQERIASGIDEIAVGVDRIAEGIEGLASAFEWGFSEIVWHLEQERAVLKDILKVLQAPLDTQAKELRTRAEEAYRNGWIDDALQDFLESEKKNPYDFSVHHSLGNIYFFHKKVPEKALEHYEKAAMYASPKSPYHASLAFLHIGLVKYLQEEFQKAYEATIEAIKLYPNLYEAHYDCARYCACLNKYDEAIDHLWEAIKGDRNYCLKAESEKDFDVMGEKLRSFFEEKRNQAQNEAKGELDKAEELIAYGESYRLTGSDKFVQAKKKHTDAKEFLSRASLFDCWDSIDSSIEAQRLVLDGSLDYLSARRQRLDQEYTTKKDLTERNSTVLSAVATIAFFILIVVAIGEKDIGVCEGTALLLIGCPILWTACWKLVYYLLIKKHADHYTNEIVRIRVTRLKTQVERELFGIEKYVEDFDVESVRAAVILALEDAERRGEKRKYSQEGLSQIYQSLPKILQIAPSSEAAAQGIQEICTENEVTDYNAIFDIAKNTGYVFMGLLPPDRFQEVLEEEVKANKSAIRQIACEINDFLFLPVKTCLETLYETKIARRIPS